MFLYIGIVTPLGGEWRLADLTANPALNLNNQNF
jgi:hypothetical protein